MKLVSVLVGLGALLVAILAVIVVLLVDPPGVEEERPLPKPMPRGGEMLTPGKATGDAVVAAPATRPVPPPPEQGVVQKVRLFLMTEDEAQRAALAGEIARDPAYDPKKVSGWLHAAGVHRPLAPGYADIQVPVDRVRLDHDTHRPVHLRIPKGYTPDRPWPVIIAYHPSGGFGSVMVGMLETFLGPDVEQFVIAAPTNYRPTSIESYRGVSTEHRSVLRHIRQTVHVDSDRVYAIGYSQGGYATWSMAVFYGDEFAAAIPVACCFDAAPEIPGLWELMMPNVANTPVLHVWGSNDILQVFGFDLMTPVGINAELNNEVVELTKRLGLDVLNYRVTGGGHEFDPPAEHVRRYLRKRRVAHPAQVFQRFRFIHQSRASWLEGSVWDGDQWAPGRRFPVNTGETKEEAIGRGIPPLLGRLEGKREGQVLTVGHDHLSEFILWIGDDMMAWDLPVTVIANGKKVFEGTVQRDLLLCLSEARKSCDFDRLRWARLRISKDGQVQPGK
jgi:predicted esterase